MLNRVALECLSVHLGNKMNINSTSLFGL